jgi:hypothetical protein
MVFTSAVRSCHRVTSAASTVVIASVLKLARPSARAAAI